MFFRGEIFQPVMLWIHREGTRFFPVRNAWLNQHQLCKHFLDAPDWTNAFTLWTSSWHYQNALHHNHGSCWSSPSRYRSAGVSFLRKATQQSPKNVPLHSWQWLIDYHPLKQGTDWTPPRSVTFPLFNIRHSTDVSLVVCPWTVWFRTVWFIC